MPTDWGIVARAVHVLAVVVWIGGVWLVTTVLLPGMKKKPPQEWRHEFDAIERRFAPQARIAVVLVLLSGLYMLYRYDLWDRFTDSRYWWMHPMVFVWLLFAAALFIIEPLIIPRIVNKRSRTPPETAFARTLWIHYVMLALSSLPLLRQSPGAMVYFERAALLLAWIEPAIRP